MKRILLLPWPPSVNHYWGTNGKYRYITDRGKQYREDVLSAAYQAYCGKPAIIRCAVKVTIEANPPDRRARDLDNLLKAPLDALAKAGVIIDDKQVDDLRIYRGPLVQQGRLMVTVEAIGNGSSDD
jgi:crossover junction endodeoxyribonuclease RusA